MLIRKNSKEYKLVQSESCRGSFKYTQKCDNCFNSFSRKLKEGYECQKKLC